MDISIMLKDAFGGYQVIYYDTDQLYFLGHFLDQVKPENIINWTNSNSSYGATTENLVVYEKEDGFIKIYSAPPGMSDEEEIEYAKNCYENAFTLKIEKFIQFAYKWKELTSKNPKTILIKQIGDEFELEDLSRETFTQKVQLTETTRKNIDAMFSPKIKNGLFCGGFVVNNDKNINIENFYTDYLNVCSGDIKIANDYTFNHTFFPENSDPEKIKAELINYLESTAFRFPKNPNFSDSKYMKNYFIKQFSILGTDITIFLNKNFELIGFYPIFRKLK